jgi:two-component system chemotaxis response regulator CheB
MQVTDKIIVLGGSAGCLPVLLYLLQNLPAGFIIPLVVVLHRLKNAPSGLEKLVSTKASGLRLREPDDKDPICPGFVYFAPANYHLLVEADKTFSLDYSEPVQYSRPSIDVAFESIAAVYGAGTTAILLSGSNEDGADGLASVLGKGGTAIALHPEAAEYSVMPKAAISKNPSVFIYGPSQMLEYLKSLHLH